jgi:pimeloyl-ACP methyl ester carboxylesterase
MMQRIARMFFVFIIFGGVMISCATQQEAPGDRLALIYPDDRPFGESRFTTIFGLTIHYRVWQPDGEPVGKILLLHGIGGSTYSFDRIVPLLRADGYAVAAIDLPGFGYSDPALKFEHTAENRLELIWTLIDRLDTDDNQFNPLSRWYVVGHQMGGEFAVWMATDRPGRIAGLILVATVLGRNRPGGRMAWFPPVRWALRAWLNNSLYTVDGTRELLEGAYGQPPTEEAVDGYLAPLVRDDAERALVNFAKTVGPEIPDLAAVEAPVLFVWGSEDTWRSIEDGRLQAEIKPESRFLVMGGAGHVPMDTHAERFAGLVTSWIAAVGSPAGS